MLFVYNEPLSELYTKITYISSELFTRIPFNILHIQTKITLTGKRANALAVSRSFPSWLNIQNVLNFIG